ncbi:hypothetical protein N7G274_000227 [Stereocaulon virgatum]|uniref:DUF7730 domain-containing protein n=1 Tax=Stereocaulon virgatum TaxID=373712 RepID=A0ABR4AUA8_9LECA
MVWNTFASIFGLRTLYVRLDANSEYHQQGQEDEDKALQSVAMVTAPKSFELAVSWVSRFQEPALETLPCRVTNLIDSQWHFLPSFICDLGAMYLTGQNTL